MTARIEQTSLVETGARVSSQQQAASRRETTALLPAPFSLRCGAMLLDYTVVVAILAFTTLLARSFDRGTASDTVLVVGYLSAVAALILNFIVLAGLSGRTLGKWATGLIIERNGGRRLSFGRATLRHIVGYPLSLLTFGIGFLIAAFSAEGLALHDRLAGTIVVRAHQNKVRRGTRAR